MISEANSFLLGRCHPSFDSAWPHSSSIGLVCRCSPCRVSSAGLRCSASIPDWMPFPGRSRCLRLRHNAHGIGGAAHVGMGTPGRCQRQRGKNKAEKNEAGEQFLHVDGFLRRLFSCRMGQCFGTADAVKPKKRGRAGDAWCNVLIQLPNRVRQRVCGKGRIFIVLAPARIDLLAAVRRLTAMSRLVGCQVNAKRVLCILEVGYG